MNKRQIVWIALAIALLFVAYSTYVVYLSDIRTAEEWLWENYHTRGIDAVAYTETWGFKLALGIAIALFASTPYVFRRKKTVAVIFSAFVIISSVSLAFAWQTPFNGGTTWYFGGNPILQKTALFVDQGLDGQHFKHQIYDEWFRTSPVGISLGLLWKQNFNQTMRCTTLGNWTHPEGIAYAPIMLQSALQQSGLAFWNASGADGAGWWEYNGKTYDFLIFLANTEMYPYKGFGFKPIRACIAYAPYCDGDSPFLLRHEIGHIYGCEHCPNYCCMNPSYANYGLCTYCGNCSSIIASNLTQEW